MGDQETAMDIQYKIRPHYKRVSIEVESSPLIIPLWGYVGDIWRLIIMPLWVCNPIHNLIS
jgi:hypothetical protein